MKGGRKDRKRNKHKKEKGRKEGERMQRRKVLYEERKKDD